MGQNFLTQRGLGAAGVLGDVVGLGEGFPQARQFFGGYGFVREDYGVFVDVGGVDGSRHGVGDGRVGGVALLGFACCALLAASGGAAGVAGVG